MEKFGKLDSNVTLLSESSQLESEDLDDQHLMSSQYFVTSMMQQCENYIFGKLTFLRNQYHFSSLIPLLPKTCF